MERWKSVPGYEGMYEVSDQGQVRSLSRTVKMRDGRRYTVSGRILKRHTYNKWGHSATVLCKNGKAKAFQTHRLVLEAFVGPCPEGMVARHFPDRNPRNNNLANLQWSTRSQNMKDRVTHGTAPLTQGEHNAEAKLTEEQIVQIRKEAAKGVSQTELARQYGISRGNIWHIVKRKTWRHV